MLMNGADFHNFGKAVSRIVEGSTVYYSKPRPVYWERLFFGFESPLREILKVELKCPPLSNGVSSASSYLADVLFGLEVEMESLSKWGRTKEIAKEVVPIELIDQSCLFNYGLLLAYAYVFGILDLHSENVIFSSKKPQVVDAEIVFSKLILPDQTLLLPFKDVAFEDSALSLIFSSENSICAEDAKMILFGFSQGMIAIDSCSTELNDVFRAIHEEMCEIPIRVILRNTRKYYGYLNGRLDLDLIPEEVEQLKREEIPYFFKFLGKPELFFYFSASGAFKEVIVPGELQSAVARIGLLPEKLLTRDRLRKQLFGPGLLLLMRKLLPDDWQGCFNFDGVTLEANSNSLDVRAPWGIFRAPRLRS